MARFVFHGIDRNGSADLRTSLHAAHIAYHASRTNPVGGPLLDERGKACGTMFVFDADDLAAAEAIADGDPYVCRGLFEHRSVREFRAVDWPI